MPTPSDRAITRADAIQIVDSVTNVEKMPLGLDEHFLAETGRPVFLRWEVEQMAFKFAQEITLLADQLDFIGEMSRILITLVDGDQNTASARSDVLKRLAAIWEAARDHALPNWWPAFRDARNARSKHG